MIIKRMSSSSSYIPLPREHICQLSLTGERSCACPYLLSKCCSATRGGCQCSDCAPRHPSIVRNHDVSHLSNWVAASRYKVRVLSTGAVRCRFTMSRGGVGVFHLFCLPLVSVVLPADMPSRRYSLSISSLIKCLPTAQAAMSPCCQICPHEKCCRKISNTKQAGTLLSTVVLVA